MEHVFEKPRLWLNDFKSNSLVQGSRNFFDSNTLIAKFAFLILGLIIFVFALRFGASFLTWLFGHRSNPILIKGMIDSRQMIIVPQNPKTKGSIPIMRSDNTDTGIEFTWSVWVYVDDFSYKEHEYKHIFHKGNDNVNQTGRNSPNNGPGLYLTPDKNDLMVIMNTFETIDEEVYVRNFPINKWVNIILRVSKQNQLDIYINGTLSKRHLLSAVPKQNYGDVYVSMNGGFSGFTSDLKYFKYAIRTNKIQSILNAGPTLKLANKDNSAGTDTKTPQYLSNRWYITGADDI